MGGRRAHPVWGATPGHNAAHRRAARPALERPSPLLPRRARARHPRFAVLQIYIIATSKHRASKPRASRHTPGPMGHPAFPAVRNRRKSEILVARGQHPRQAKQPVARNQRKSEIPTLTATREMRRPEPAEWAGSPSGVGIIPGIVPGMGRRARMIDRSRALILTR